MKGSKLVMITVSMLILQTTMMAQIDTLKQEMVSMNDTYQKPYKVGGVYYKTNETAPFTGVLFGKYTNGKYLSIQEYKNGIGNGTWINYYPNGKLKEVGTYKDNRVEGPIKQYYENGNLKAEGSYAHWRKKVGNWKFYDQDGNLLRSQTFTQ
jgi:antitoxin component YwqK of YwqJK toxin-antitoxin module